jgi:hypothetical protein
MIRRALILLLLLPSLAFAQNFKGYRTTTLDAVVDDWNGKTRDEGPGISFSRPEKIKFIATLRAAPVACSNAALAAVLTMMNFADMLKQVSVTHCVTFGSTGGRTVIAYVQDTLVPGMNTDARVGGSVEIYADFLAYQVNAERSRNAPIMLVNRFEPR